MKLAAQGIERVIADDELHAGYIIPNVFDQRAVEAIADADADAARRTREPTTEALY